MDKETLSNYGWIVICVLVLAVMLAFATPFGTFIADGFKATYTGLFDTGDSALDVGLSAVGVKNTLECGHGRKESGDHSQLGCGHFACEECGCVPAPCGVEGHWSGDGLDHTKENRSYHNGHEYRCQCDGWVVPEGGIYTARTTIDGKLAYAEGEQLPCGYMSKQEDKYTQGDYTYSYWPRGDEHWGVYVNDKTKTSYGVILESINGKPITHMQSTFYGCTNLITAPEIPNTVMDMYCTFTDCTALTSAPAIPESVTKMEFAFQGCSSLKNAPAIPSGVTNLGQTFMNCKSLISAPNISNCTELTILRSTFNGCTSLTGTIEINAEPSVYKGCFSNVDMTNITLTGSVSKDVLNLIGGTGKNWTPIS